MFDTALPWWATNGIDRANGGYVEHFDLTGRGAGAAFKRTRVTCRQIYVFSHAATLGFRPGVELAAHGVKHLVEKAWMGTDRGFARRTTRAGDVLDPTQDLYDLAFALFSFGWYLRASCDESALGWAHKTLDTIESKLRHPSGQGFLHEAPAAGWRQQNPHMHLIEAALSVYEASRDERFATLAIEIAELFRRRFFDLETGTLSEFFTEDWSRAPGDDGRTIEPGHQFEWAWILINTKRLVGIDLSEEIRSLVGFSERFGVDRQTGLTYNSVRDDGVPIDRGSRTWPNTERLKAAIALFELDGVDPWPVLEGSARALFDYHLNHQPAGTWIDAFDADSKPMADKIPTSTLYHVFLAFAEVLRVGARA